MQHGSPYIEQREWLVQYFKVRSYADANQAVRGMSLEAMAEALYFYDIYISARHGLATAVLECD